MRSDVSKSKAISLLDKGNYEEALSILEGLKGRSEDKDIYLLLGIAYQKVGKHGMAVESLRSFETSNPDSDQYHYYLGVSLYELKRYKEALNEFDKSELAGVKPEESSYYAGYIYFLDGKYEQALPYFIKTIKQDGAYKNTAHYYAGVCLYKKGLEDRSSFESALYHFDKVLKDNGPLSQEAKHYIEVIKEFLNEGTARYKKRLNLKSKADLFYTTNRTVTPIEGIPNFGVQADNNRLAADFLFDVGFAPVIENSFAMFVNYAFLIDTALSTEIDYTNVQKHKPGVSFQFFNQLRTWETSLNYSYSMDFLDTDKVRKIDGTHVISFSYDQSITSNWALGIKAPFRLYNGKSGVWGSFEGKSFELSIASYLLFGKTSILLEPSFITYSLTNGVIPSFKYYSLNTKFNLPWRILTFWPSLKLSPGKISSATVNRATYDLACDLGATLGTGMKFNVFIRGREGFLSTNWELLSGIGFEYIY